MPILSGHKNKKTLKFSEYPNAPKGKIKTPLFYFTFIKIPKMAKN